MIPALLTALWPLVEDYGVSVTLEPGAVRQHRDPDAPAIFLRTLDWRLVGDTVLQYLHHAGLEAHPVDPDRCAPAIRQVASSHDAAAIVDGVPVVLVGGAFAAESYWQQGAPAQAVA